MEGSARKLAATPQPNEPRPWRIPDQADSRLVAVRKGDPMRRPRLEAGECGAVFGHQSYPRRVERLDGYARQHGIESRPEDRVDPLRLAGCWIRERQLIAAPP